MLDGHRYILVEQDASGRVTLFESQDMTDIAEFIAEKEAPGSDDARADGGEAWRERLPRSLDGGED